MIWPVSLSVWVFVYELSGFWLESRCSQLNFRFRAFLSKTFFDIQVTRESRLNRKRVCDMTKTYRQMHGADK